MKLLLPMIIGLASPCSWAGSYIQLPAHAGGQVSDGIVSTAADDFQFANATNISGATWWGVAPTPSGSSNNFTVVFLQEFLGLPGPAVSVFTNSVTITPTGDVFSEPTAEYRFEMHFTAPFAAAANTRYWICVYGGGVNWQWEASSAGNHDAMQRQLNNVANPWRPTPNGLAFELQFQPSAAQLHLEMYPGLWISGTTGAIYRVEYSDLVSPTNWTGLTNVFLSTSPQLFLDLSVSNRPSRYYRALGVD